MVYASLLSALDVLVASAAVTGKTITEETLQVDLSETRSDGRGHAYCRFSNGAIQKLVLDSKRVKHRKESLAMSVVS